MDADKQVDHLVNWLRDEVEAAGYRGLVFGLSGGVDSATVAVLCRRAFRDRHLALIMPVHSEPREREDALLVVDTFHLRMREIDLEPAFDGIRRSLGIDDFDPAAADVPVGNLKPRLRMASLYYFANELDYLVVGGGNRSELTIGYFTKYGDGGVDLLPLGHLVKREVRDLASHLGVPRSIIDKPPTAGLWQGHTDEGELGFSYEELDRYLVEGEGDEELEGTVEGRRRMNAHKLRTPKMPPPLAQAS